MRLSVCREVVLGEDALCLGTSASNKNQDDPDWVMDAISGCVFIF